MSYEKMNELPKRVKKMPKEAQEIYKKAFDKAWDIYEEPEEGQEHISREEIAHEVAWASLRNKYKKENN